MSPIDLFNVVILLLCCQNKCLAKLITQMFARNDILLNTTIADMPIFSKPGCRSGREGSVICSQRKGCVSFFYNAVNGQCTGHAVQLDSTEPGSPTVRSVYYTWVYEPSCPTGFTVYKSSCYLFSETGGSYEEGESFCRASNARLAEIDSKDEEDFIRGQLQRLASNYSYCIGGTDLRVEGVWTWDNPVRNISYLNWYPGEPTNQAEHCLSLFQGNNYRMNDCPCTGFCRYVCEKK